MRLKRLDLTRYGKFTDHSIDFGDRSSDRPDLHIVYGPNEAGKSTALAGFLDLLFGIEARSRFNFIHPYNTMQIGASLEFAGRVHDFIRIKRTQNDLRDAAGNPVAQSMIASTLGGVDRDSYRAMFSLDDDTLEAGGESILASKGDLGQLLFSASTGLADIGRNLVNLRAEADGFYRYHARTGELQELKTRLATLKEDRDRIDTAASKYAQLVEDRERTRSQYDEAIATRGSIQSRIDEIRRQSGALPRLSALRAARQRLQPLSGLPTAPVAWPEQLPSLQRDEVEISVQSKSIDDDIRRRETELETLIIDDVALRLADRVDRLGILHARHLTAEKDIPDRLLEAHEEDVKITAILVRVGREGEPNPGGLILGTATVGVLRELLENRSGLDAATQSAANEATTAQHRLEEAEARFRSVAGDAVPDDNRAAAIVRALAPAHENDYATRRRIAERSRALAQAQFTDQLTTLHPWSGEPEQLVSLPVPEPAIIEHWKAALSAARNEQSLLEVEAQKLSADRIRLEAERAALAGIAGVVTDQDAAEVRTAREAAWAAHRRTLDGHSADTFEATLRHDDLVTNARLKHETDIARLHQAAHDLARVAADLQILEEARAGATIRMRDIHAEIDAALSPLSLLGFTVDQLEAWLRRRTQLLETRAMLRQSERDLEEAEADAHAVRAKLTKVLNLAHVPYDATAENDELRTIAQSALEREAELKRSQADVEDRLREVNLRKRNLETALRNDRAWQTAWLDACAKCWLGKTDPPPLVAAVREILPALEDLGRAIEKRASLLDRVKQMRDDQTAFSRDVGAIATAMSIATDTPLDLYQKIIERVARARAVQVTRDVRTKELADVHERRRIMAEKRAIHAGRKAEMTELFQVDSLTEVVGKLSDVKEKVELERQITEATQEILDAIRLPSIEQAESALDNADRAALETELAELTARLADQDQRTRELYSAHSKAADQVDAVGGDGAVAIIEEQRRTILLDIEDRARRYLRLRAGIVAAEHALRSYRRHHRSSMMARASELFRIISRDAYSGLASQPDKENEILVALAADGKSKVASDLSKGTRFQLYLALRVAGYHEFARSHSPVPFIADDIMETFDNHRAEEAIRVLASMAEVGQVIYLTHHPHLCDIAQRVLPGVRVHEISPGQA